jgi:hypothetical protein
MTLSHYRRVAQVHMSCCVQFVDIPMQPMHPTAGTRWEFGAGDQRSSIAELAPCQAIGAPSCHSAGIVREGTCLEAAAVGDQVVAA